MTGEWGGENLWSEGGSSQLTLSPIGKEAVTYSRRNGHESYYQSQFDGYERLSKPEPVIQRPFNIDPPPVFRSQSWKFSRRFCRARYPRTYAFRYRLAEPGRSKC